MSTHIQRPFHIHQPPDHQHTPQTTIPSYSAYREATARGIPVYLFFSVNESRRFCGVAMMASPVDPRASLPDWLPVRSSWEGLLGDGGGVMQGWEWDGLGG